MWVYWASIRYDTASMELEVIADLFHGSLVSIGQLCKAFPSLSGQGVHHFSFTPICILTEGALKVGCGCVAVGLLGGNMVWHCFHGHYGDHCWPVPWFAWVHGKAFQSISKTLGPRDPPLHTNISRVLTERVLPGLAAYLRLGGNTVWHRVHGREDYC